MGGECRGGSYRLVLTAPPPSLSLSLSFSRLFFDWDVCMRASINNKCSLLYSHQSEEKEDCDFFLIDQYKLVNINKYILVQLYTLFPCIFQMILFSFVMTIMPI